jgi:hypothetical protein
MEQFAAFSTTGKTLGHFFGQIWYKGADAR